MNESAKASLQQLLHRWITERETALREALLGTLNAGMGSMDPDDPLLERILDLSESREGPPALAEEAPFGDISADTEADLGTGLALLAAAPGQGDVLKRLLEAIAPFTERSALFVVKQGIASLYVTRGFESDAPRPGAPVVPPPELEGLIQGRTASLAEPGPAYAALLAPLSRFEASDLRIFPLRLRRKVVALLLVDSGLRQVFDRPNHVLALVHVAEAHLASLSAQREEEKPAAPPAAPLPAAPVHAQPTQRIPDPIAESDIQALDPKVRANAERSARVLVGDIELYFPQKVQQGQAQGNLYGLLREELERSRASFIERYGADVEAQHGIFLQTILHQLCQGDASKLGPAPWA
jgi:hypothetical protein